MTNKKILAIIGSPRRNGNTELLTDEILAGAKKSNLVTEKIVLNELEIKPCQACNYCQKTKECRYKDDMLKIVKLMKESDVWIFGTPVYWWGPTAQFKAFIDRWYGVSREIFKDKKIILVISLGANSEHYARHTLGMFKDIIPYRNAILFETIVATGVSKKGVVKNRPELLEKARKIGNNI